MDIRRIRRAVLEGRYEFTAHALEEMDEDGLTEIDVRQVLLRGSLAAQLIDDARGARLVVFGRPRRREIEIEVVCRFLASGLMRIITVYVLGSD